MMPMVMVLGARPCVDRAKASATTSALLMSMVILLGAKLCVDGAKASATTIIWSSRAIVARPYQLFSCVLLITKRRLTPGPKNEPPGAVTAN